MSLPYRYLGLLLVVATGWLGATMFSDDASHAHSAPATDAPLLFDESQFVLRRDTEAEDMTPVAGPDLPSLDDTEFVAQLPNPPAALVVEPQSPAPPPVPHYSVPEMAPQYESLVDRQRVHRIIEGDTLPRIASQYLGSAARYREIFDANRDVLQRPDVLPIGLELQIPAL